MASLSDFSTLEKIMAINIAPSGMGKTGAVGSLANAGYKLRILDFDSGCQILRDPIVVKPEARERVIIQSLTDRMGPVQILGKNPGDIITVPGVIGQPTAFSNGLSLLNKWDTKSEKLGPVSDWGTDTILVIDTLTFMSRSALYVAQNLNNRLNQKPSQNEWGIAMNMLESALEMLHSSAIRCHVLVNAHVTYINKPGAERQTIKQGQGEIDITPQMAFPYTLGNKLPPKIEQYFNLGLTMTGDVKKMIETTGVHDGVRTKNPVPNKLKRPYAIQNGMAEIFEAILGHGPKDTTE